MYQSLLHRAFIVSPHFSEEIQYFTFRALLFVLLPICLLECYFYSAALEVFYYQPPAATLAVTFAPVIFFNFQGVASFGDLVSSLVIYGNILPYISIRVYTFIEISCNLFLLIDIYRKYIMVSEVVTIPKKEREKISTTVEKDLIDTLRLLSEETRINMNLLLDEAIADLLQKYGKVLSPGE